MIFQEIHPELIQVLLGPAVLGALRRHKNLWYFDSDTGVQLDAPQLREIANRIEGENLSVAIHAIYHPWTR